MFENLVSLAPRLVANGSATSWGIGYSAYYPFYGLDNFLMGVMLLAAAFTVLYLITGARYLEYLIALNAGIILGTYFDIFIVGPMVYSWLQAPNPDLYLSVWCLRARAHPAGKGAQA